MKLIKTRYKIGTTWFGKEADPRGTNQIIVIPVEPFKHEPMLIPRAKLFEVEVTMIGKLLARDVLHFVVEEGPNELMHTVYLFSDKGTHIIHEEIALVQLGTWLEDKEDY